MLHEDTHTAYCDNEVTPYVEFDYAALDGELSENPDATQLASEALARIISYCWKTGDPNAAFLKFTAISKAVHPAILEGCNMKQIADRVGCTKQNLSKHLREFMLAFRVHLGQRSDSQRATMREARLRQRGPDGNVICRNKLKAEATLHASDIIDPATATGTSPVCVQGPLP